MQAYPNPATVGQQISVSLTDGNRPYSRPVEVTLVSVEGAVLFNKTASTGEITMGIPSVASGVYVVRLRTEEGTVYNTKLVITHYLDPSRNSLIKVI